MSSARDKNMAKKAAAEAEKEAKLLEEEERRNAAEWSKGAKDTSKTALADAERDRKLKLKLENAALLEAEEAALSGIAKKKTPKKKGKDDFDLLNAALASAPKTKAQKEAESKKIADQERKKKEEEARETKQQRLKEKEEFIKEQARKGIIVDHADELLLHSRDLNTLPDGEDEIVVSGIEGAIDALAVSDQPVDAHPEKRRKALYNAFLERMLPIMKEEHPGLRLQQYKERIFEMWQTSPENPVNMNPSGP